MIFIHIKVTHILLVLCITGTLPLVSSLPSGNMLYDTSNVEKLFEEFIGTFKKQYKNELEKKSRFDIFKRNLELIKQQNMRKDETATFGVNQFTDITAEEYKMTYLTRIPDTRTPCGFSKNSSSSSQAPKSWDWRQKNAVTRVKNQQTCGSCWAFSAIGNLEGQYAKKYGKLVEFSEQQLLDCTYSNQGCNGGWMNNALKEAKQKGGIMAEQDYPYQAVQKQCQFNPRAVRAKITKCYDLKIKSEEELKEILVKNGPIAFAVDATDFQLYQGGILEYCTKGQLNHAVLLVGYETEGGIPHWIIKNSWSEQWGDRGYIKVRMGVNACNMMSSPFTTSEVA